MNQQRGVKRLCAACGTRFYDLMSKPICPKCHTEFVIPVAPPPRRMVKSAPPRFAPSPIAAGSPEDLPEVDDDGPIAPTDDDDDSSPAPDDTEIE
jgi:hypothetical protein